MPEIISISAFAVARRRSQSRAHALNCFLQPLSFRQDDYGVKDRVFVWCRVWRDGPDRAVNQRVIDEGGWEIHELASGHDFMKDNPEAAERLICAVAADRA
jgi:hypothetical protein